MPFRLDFVPEATGFATSNKGNLETIVLGGGCYWCVEAVYENLNGVEKVVSGFAGGTVENPSYEEVCSGRTGAAEVVEITYDKTKTNLDEIFKVFFTVHDPTTLNRQGADVGTQYRSAIFYKNEEQKKVALRGLENIGDFQKFFQRQGQEVGSEKRWQYACLGYPGQRCRKIGRNDFMVGQSKRCQSSTRGVQSTTYGQWQDARPELRHHPGSKGGGFDCRYAATIRFCERSERYRRQGPSIDQKNQEDQWPTRCLLQAIQG